MAKEIGCNNVVQCPYCDTDYHICELFEPPDDITEISGQEEKNARCDKCKKSFIVTEEIAVIYTAYIDQTNDTKYNN